MVNYFKTTTFNPFPQVVGFSENSRIEFIDLYKTKY